MRVLVVAATPGEVDALGSAADRHSVEFLITGVGMVATAVKVSRALALARYDLALNLGVCGSLDPALPPGSVVHVISDRVSELGAEDGDAFLTLEEMDLAGEHSFINPAPPISRVLAALPLVDGITVNTVHGNARSIAAVVARFRPHVESMEGAAFMSACLAGETPFAQVRGVSNVVEPRNRDAWKLAEAISNLNRTAQAILAEL